MAHAETPRRALPATAPPSLTAIPDLRMLFRYRVEMQDFFLPGAGLSDARCLTAWVALHDGAHTRFAHPGNGGMTTVLDGLAEAWATLLVPNVAAGERIRWLVEGTLLGAGVDAPAARRLAPNTRVLHKRDPLNLMRSDTLEGYTEAKPGALVAQMSAHTRRAVARRPETVWMELPTPRRRADPSQQTIPWSYP